MADMVLRVVIGGMMPLLASCASSGLYNMSEEWCTQHMDASAARCPENHKLAHRAATQTAEATP